MNRLLLLFLSTFCIITLHTRAQQQVIDFKRGNKLLKRYWPGEFISFQPDRWQWRKGMITLIRKDSFFIRPMIVRYGIYNSDTTWLPVEGYATTTFYAFPKPPILIDYIDGRFQVSRTGGHMHWYWIKSGWIFRAGALGYTGLHITNGLIQKDLTWRDSKTKLLSAGGVFLGGWLLKKNWKPNVRVRGKKRVVITSL